MVLANDVIAVTTTPQAVSNLYHWASSGSLADIKP
jgi:hypothetical protein